MTGKNPHVFRVAQAQLDGGLIPSVRVEGQPERTLEDLVSLEPTYLQHEAVTGIPFTASYYSLDKVFASLEPKEQKFIRTIDDHIAKQINSGKFTDSAEAATQIIKDLESKLKLTDNNDPYYRAERISNYLNSVGEFKKQQMVKPKLVKQMVAEAPPEIAAVAKKAVSTVKQVAKAANEQVGQLKAELGKAEVRVNKEIVKQKDDQISKLLSVNEKLIKDKERFKYALQSEKERLAQRENELRQEIKLEMLKEQNEKFNTSQSKIKLALARLAKGL